MRGTNPAYLIAVAAGLVFTIVPANAQMGAFGWSPNQPRLSADDWNMLSQSADALNQAPSPYAGESRSWANPTSRNSGTVTLERVFNAHDMPCHALRYAVTVATERAPQTYRFTWCRTEAGEWKILQ